MSLLKRAAMVARQQFNRELASCGTEAEWRVRIADRPDRPTNIADAYGRPDPVTAPFAGPDYDNPDVYSIPGVTIRVWVKQQDKYTDEGKRLAESAEATVYARLGTGLGEGDILLIDGEVWMVDNLPQVTVEASEQATVKRVMA